MKKEFVMPELTFVRFDANDVIATSGCPIIPGETTPVEIQN